MADRLYDLLAEDAIDAIPLTFGAAIRRTRQDAGLKKVVESTHHNTTEYSVFGLGKPISRPISLDAMRRCTVRRIAE